MPVDADGPRRDPPGLSGERRQDIELLRILSAFGIVWFHTRMQGAAVAYAGLVGFLILSITLSGASGRPDLDTVARRARRLLLPWMVWFGVYGLYNHLRGLAVFPATNGILAGVLAGPSIHLWYLPFIFLGLAGLDVVKAHTSRLVSAVVSGAAALAVIASVPQWRPVTLQLAYPTLQWAEAVAPVLVGVFLLTADALPRGIDRALSAALLATALWLCTRNPYGIALSIGIAACLLIRSGSTARLIRVNLRTLSDATFGLYLVHSLVHAELLRRAALPNEALPFAVFGLSAALAVTWRRLWPRASAWWP